MSGNFTDIAEGAYARPSTFNSPLQELSDALDLLRSNLTSSNTSISTLFSSVSTLDTRLDQLVYNVKDYGAVGDGVTDETAAINLALAAMTSGGVLWFPAGTYLCNPASFNPRASNVVFRGAGMFVSTLKPTGSGTAMLSSSGSYLVRNIAFEDIGFDGNSVVTIIADLYRIHVRGRIRFTRCRMWKMGTYGLVANSCDDLIIEYCLFEGPGNAQGIAIQIQGAARRIQIIRNWFRYVNSGILIDTGATTSQLSSIVEDIEIAYNYFDFAWWALTARASGSGGNVTYSATTLTDTDATFLSLGLAADDNVRAMATKESGTGTFSTGRLLTDATATFQTAGVKRGEIVRTSGGAFGIVSHLTSETQLWVEEWLSDVDRQPTTQPATGETYTVYGVVIGKIASATDEELTVDRWHDLDGTTATPANGTRYEVLATRPNYCINVEYAGRRLKIHHNWCRRGWSDQISVFGYEAQVIDNDVEEGQDIGVTLYGQRHNASMNRVRRQGAVGMWGDTDDSAFIGNIVTDSTWVNGVNSFYLGDIVIEDGNRNLLNGNILQRTNSAQSNARYGYVIAAVNGNANGNRIVNSISSGHVTSDLRLYGANCTNTYFDASNSFNTVEYASSATVPAFASNATQPTYTKVRTMRTANNSATTITNVLGGTDGDEFWLLVPDAVSAVANNATIKVRSGSSVSLAQHGMYYWKNHAGVWYVND